MKTKTLLWTLVALIAISPAFAIGETVIDQSLCTADSNIGTGINTFGQSFIFNTTYSKAFPTIEVRYFSNYTSAEFPAGTKFVFSLHHGESVATTTNVTLAGCNNYVYNLTQASGNGCTDGKIFNVTFPDTCLLNQSGNYTWEVTIYNEGSGQIGSNHRTGNVYTQGKCYACDGAASFSADRDTTFIVYANTSAFEITAYDIYNGTSISTFNATVNGTHYTTTTGNITTKFITNEGNVSIEVNSSNYFNNQTTTYNMSSAATYQANLTRFTGIFVYDYMSGVNLQNFTINYTNNTASGNYYTLNGLVYVPINNYDWNITVWNISNNGKNYTFDTALLNGSTQGFIRNYTFYVFESNSYNITFHDELNNSIIYSENSTAENTLVEFLGDLHSYTTTINGTGWVSLIIPQDYIIRFRKNNGTSYGRYRQFYVTLTNQTTTNLHLYMIREADSTDLTITVYDESTLNPISDAVVYLQRFNVTANSYQTVAMYATDVDGKAYFDVEAQKELYRFRVDYPSWQTQKLMTEPLYIETSDINLYLSLSTPVGEGFFNSSGITGTITANSSHMTVSWLDSASIATLYCFSMKKYTQYGKLLMNTSCTAANSGGLSIQGYNGDATYYGIFNVTISGTERTVATGWTDILTDAPPTAYGQYSILLAAAIFVTLAFISSLHIIAGVLATAGLVFAKYLGLLPIEWGYIIMAVIAALILAAVLKRK